MRWVIYFFGSGIVFFLGVCLVLAAVLLAWTRRPRWLARSVVLFALLGAILIALSATPLPYWFYAVAAAITLAWIVVEAIPAERVARRRSLFRFAVVLVWLVGLGMEVPYHLSPRIDLQDNPTLHIIGDSVTAGMGERNLVTWPRILAESHEIDVRDHSRMGATVASALKQAEQLPDDGGILVLEIGGNDILGSTTVAKFEDSLEQLLTRVCSPQRTVLMFELPLPPLQNDYGLAQRRLAARHGVCVIPRRILATVLTIEGATVDSVHLSQPGHERMAEAVWHLIRPGYQK